MFPKPQPLSNPVPERGWQPGSHPIGCLSLVQRLKISYRSVGLATLVVISACAGVSRRCPGLWLPSAVRQGAKRTWFFVVRATKQSLVRMDVGRHAGKPAWDSVPCSAGPASSQNGPFSNGMSFFLEPTTVRLTCMAIRGNCEVRILLCMSLGSGIMNARALSLSYCMYVCMYIRYLALSSKTLTRPRLIIPWGGKERSQRHERLGCLGLQA